MMSTQNRTDKRLAALRGELEQIDTTMPRLKEQLQALHDRRMLLHGAILELTDLKREEAQDAEDANDASSVTESAPAEAV